MSTRQSIATVLGVSAILIGGLALLALSDPGYLGVLWLLMLIGGVGLAFYAIVLFYSKPSRPRRIGRVEFGLGTFFGVILGVACLIHAFQAIDSGKFPRWSRADTETKFSAQPVKFITKLTVSVGLGAGLLGFFLPPLLRGHKE